MNAPSKPNVSQQIIQILDAHGPLKGPEIAGLIEGATEHTVLTKALKLKNDGFLDRNGDMVYSLAEGVTASTYANASKKSAGTAAPSHTPAPAAPISLEPRAQFEEVLRSASVKPPEVIPTITEIFFGGNIDDLKWLHTVLRREAPNWVAAHQARLVLTYWSQKRNIPYNANEFVFEGPETGRKAEAEPKPVQKPSPAKVLEETGLLYKVVKDRDGDWVPELAADGTLAYEAALDRCERLNAIRAVSHQGSRDDDDDSEGGGEDRPAPRGGKRGKRFEDVLMEKIVDAFIAGNKGSNAEESAVIKRLEDEVRGLKDQQDRDWKERIEANLAAIAARDPWSDPAELARIRQVLGNQPSAITDSSPAVQLIKDSTEKADRNFSRLLGMVERVALQGDAFRPEETRSPQEKEAKAGDLLHEAESRERSVELRKRVFDV
jgi:hypothetical protein